MPNDANIPRDNQPPFTLDDHERLAAILEHHDFELDAFVRSQGETPLSLPIRPLDI